MDDSFWDFACDIRSCILNIERLESITKSTRKFIQTLEKIDYIQKETFKDKCYTNLLEIKFFLLKQKTNLARSLHDKIFIKKLNFEKAPPLKITKQFDEFVKGITYFASKNSNADIPIYHRLTSCGTGTDAFRKSYNRCNSNMKKTQRSRVKHQIQTCYIERLIYDDLYKKQTLFFPKKGNASPSQDEGHSHWLEQTKNDYLTCFPHDIKVSIEDFHNNTSIPTVLRIFENTIEQVYKRKIVNIDEYDPIVECYMFKNNKLIKFKMQTFNKINKWKSPPV
jgi:hypothetical protein